MSLKGLMFGGNWVRIFPEENFNSLFILLQRRRGITSSHSINVTENSSQDPVLTMSWMEEGHHSEEPAAEAVQQQS